MVYHLPVRAAIAPDPGIGDRSPQRSKPAGTRLASLVLALFLALAFVVAGGRSAAAHAQLVSSDPADGAVLAAMPQEVEFEFNEEVDPTFAQVVVAGPDGRNHAVDQTTVDGPRVSAPVPDGLESGAVTARYRVVSADGHPISGEIRFTVEASPTASPNAPAAAIDTPAQGAEAQPDPSAVDASAAPGDTEAENLARGTSSAEAPNFAPYLLMGLAAIAMIGVGIFFFRSDRRPGR